MYFAPTNLKTWPRTWSIRGQVLRKSTSWLWRTTVSRFATNDPELSRAARFVPVACTLNRNTHSATPASRDHLTTSIATRAAAISTTTLTFPSQCNFQLTVQRTTSQLDLVQSSVTTRHTVIIYDSLAMKQYATYRSQHAYVRTAAKMCKCFIHKFGNLAFPAPGGCLFESILWT